MDCIFCAIAQKQIPSTIVYEDEDFVVFPDLNPQAKIHWLIVPKKHVANILELSASEDGAALYSRLLEVLPEIAKKAGVAESGFRLVNNCGSDGGQTVHHLHFHLLGGEKLDDSFRLGH